MKEFKRISIFVFLLIKEYLISLGLTIIGRKVNKWKVFYIGELGVTQLNFLPGAFYPTGRLFLKAEKVPGLAKGTLNDVYNQMKVDEENRVAIYCKQIVDSQL